MPSFERFVALRYLWSAQGRSEGRRFLRVVTVIAIGGVIVGVAALLVSLAIVRGFSSEITGKIISFGSHIQVSKYGGDPIPGASLLEDKIQNVEGVKDVVPVVQEFALLRRSSQDIDGVLFSGIESPTDLLTKRIIDGDLTLQNDSLGRAPLVVGRELTRLLNLELGDLVTAYSIKETNTADNRSFISRPRVEQFFIAGIYETSFARYDEFYVFTALNVARELFQYGEDEISRFDVIIDDIDNASVVAANIDDAIGFPLVANTVFQIFRQYFAWVRLQQTITPVVISLIVLVAAFNIFGTLIMIMFEKTREIGVLGSMGASRRSIFKLFLWLGILIGGVGVIGGQVVAYVLILVQKKYGIIPLPAESYYMDVAPVELSGIDFVIVGVLTIILCAFSSSIPAIAASFVKPIQAIRFR